LFSRRRALTGAPAVRRMKMYSAQSGYVYHYFYEGRRALGRDETAGTEFVFSVSADRKTWRNVGVQLGEDAVSVWQAAHARELFSTERYAVAKMALFQAFDERAAPARMAKVVRVREADISAIAGTLGFE
jgi:hypothetical protein